MRILLLSLTILLGSLGSYADDKTDKQAFHEAYKAYQEAVNKGRRSDAVEYAGQAYELGRSIYGDNHKNTAALTLNYGKLLQGDEAEAMLEEALKLHENVYGTDTIELVDPLIDLAASKVQYSYFGKAYKLYKRALKIVEKHDNSNQILMGIIYTEMGTTSLSRAQSTKALGYLKKAEKLLSANDSANAQWALAKAKFWKGKYRIATGKYKSATTELNASLPIFHKYSPDGNLTLTNHAFLVHAYEKMGLRDEATKHCQAIGAAKPINPNQDYRPVYFTQPEYPRSANIAGSEGYVIVDVTVDKSGFVKDPKIIETKGHSSFKKAAIEAVEKFRYAPRHENGIPVDTTDVRYKFTFDLAN